MKMSASVMANELVSHGKKEKSTPRLSKTGRVGHPEVRKPGKCKLQSLVDNING
jgi:hypothetical protein